MGLDTASSLGHLIAASQKAKKPRTKPSAISEASKRGRLLGRGPDRGLSTPLPSQRPDSRLYRAGEEAGKPLGGM